MTEQQEMLCITGTCAGVGPPLQKLLAALQERGGSISLCRLTRHGDASVITLSVEGHWGALSRIETALPALADSIAMNLQAIRTKMEPEERDFRPYAADVFAPEQQDLLPSLVQYFTEAGASIRDLSAQHYRSGISGGNMMNVSLVLDMPMQLSPHALRDGFMDLCDEMRADGVLDPIKS